MSNIYSIIPLLIIGRIICMSPKHHKFGLKFLKYSIIVYMLFNSAPIIYSYFDKIIK